MTIEEVIATHYGSLSAKLREAADVVARHPVEVATRSLRAVSTSTGVAPATLSRLARALGFADYEAMREVARGAVERQVLGMGDKAQRLQVDAGQSGSILDRQAVACIANITELQELNPSERMDQAVRLLLPARNVVLFGAFGATGAVEYLAHLASYFTSNWMLAGRRGASLGAALAGLGPEDVLLIVTKSPYARRAVIAAETAHELGAATILVTDSYTCPALAHATVSFLVPSESPQFFSSYAATMVLMESLIATYVAKSSDDTLARIREVETRNRALGEFWENNAN